MTLTNPAEHFWARVDTSGDCWLWTGPTAGKGYGVMAFNARRAYAHRFSYELANGPIPAGLHICHTCDNPPCVRPEHLFAGTRSQNMLDAKAKGRAVWPVLRGEQAPGARLTRDQVTAIRVLGAASVPMGGGAWQQWCKTGQPRITQYALAAQFGVSDSLISAILHRKVWVN